MPKDLRLLLDTHIWIWLMEDTGQLSDVLIARINQSAKRKHIFVAAISLWEVSMLAEKKRIEINKDPCSWLNSALMHPGLILCPLTAEIASESCKLPGKFHGDPTDRMIVATSRLENLLLITKDESILHYGKAGHVNCLTI